MNSLKVLGKYLDQPRLVKRFSNAVPAILISGGTLYTAHHVAHTPKEERNKEAVKTSIIMAATVASALAAPKAADVIADKINALLKKGAKAAVEAAEHKEIDDMSLDEINGHNSTLIDAFVSKTKNLPEGVSEILEKAKTKILNIKEIKKLYAKLENHPAGKDFLNGKAKTKDSDEIKGLIPDPENIDSAHIFGEISRLSILGAIPVLGGIAGGITADKVTEKDWKSRVPNKIKEGAYQYLANIFLCNVGAGAALAIMEKTGVNSKPARAAGMITGILAVGVIGGSAIANFIGKTCIDPFLNRKHKHKHRAPQEFGHIHESLYSERKPEMLDIGLHTDDIATVAVLSGLKWIEPALPILYSISGYRAGIGYRNGEDNVQF